MQQSRGKLITYAKFCLDYLKIIDHVPGLSVEYQVLLKFVSGKYCMKKEMDSSGLYSIL